MERSAVRLCLRSVRVLLGFFAVQMVVAQTPKADLSIERETPMATEANPDFLVATIKPSDPAASGGWGFPTEGHHISCVNASVATIFMVAYGIHAKQIAGGPEWLTKDRYDINGIPSVAGVPNLRQMREMYKNCSPTASTWSSTARCAKCPFTRSPFRKAARSSRSPIQMRT